MSCRGDAIQIDAIPSARTRPMLVRASRYTRAAVTPDNNAERTFSAGHDTPVIVQTAAASIIR